jgi:hypothetical protein
MPPRDYPQFVPRGDLLLRAPLFSIENKVTMLDDGPMVCDLSLQVLPEDQWIIEGVSFQASVALAPSGDDWKPPVSGLFLCPLGTEPETQDDAARDLNLRSRQVPIPLDPYTGFRNIVSTLPGATNVGAVQMVGQSGFQVSVPGGWFIRAILVLFPGGDGIVGTGPGTNSYGTLRALVRVLRNLDTFQGD